MQFPNRVMTYGELLAPAMQIIDQKEADEYFEALVEYQMRYTPEKDKAEAMTRSNLGYFAGYYDTEIMQRVQRLFGAKHPIFGTSIPTPEEAFRKGMELAQEHSHDAD